MCEKCKEVLERRGFLKKSLAVTATLMAASLLNPGTLSATVSDFPKDKKIDSLIISEDLEIKNGENGSAKVFVSRPKKEGKFKPILIGHGFVDTTYLTCTATRFALAGYAAFAIMEVKKDNEKLEYVGIGRAYNAAVEQLFSKEYVAPDALALFGFCGAGTEALRIASTRPIIKAIVTAYGNVTIDKTAVPEGTVEKIKAPIQSHFGLLDTVFPLQSAKTYEQLGKKVNKKASVYFYEDCGHSYCNFSIAQGK